MLLEKANFCAHSDGVRCMHRILVHAPQNIEWELRTIFQHGISNLNHWCFSSLELQAEKMRRNRGIFLKVFYSRLHYSLDGPIEFYCLGLETFEKTGNHFHTANTSVTLPRFKPSTVFSSSISYRFYSQWLTHIILTQVAGARTVSSEPR